MLVACRSGAVEVAVVVGEVQVVVVTLPALAAAAGGCSTLWL